MHLQCSSDGSNGIVLMGRWYSKNRHHSITDKFFNEPIIAFDDLSNFSRNEVHNFFNFLRIKPLDHGSIPPDATINIEHEREGVEKEVEF